MGNSWQDTGILGEMAGVSEEKSDIGRWIQICGLKCLRQSLLTYNFYSHKKSLKIR